MKQTTISYHEWNDIRKQICFEMGIEEKYFRDYHELVGGKYKDLWHEWIEYFGGVPINGYIQPISWDSMESLESKLEWIRDDEKDWLEPFINAVYKIWEEHNIEYVKFDW